MPSRWLFGDVFEALKVTLPVRGDAPPKDRISTEEGLQEIFAVAVAALFPAHDPSESPTQQSTEDDREGIV